MNYFAHGGDESTMMHGFEDGIGYGGGMGSWVWMVLMVILVTAGIVWLVRSVANSQTSSSTNDALSMLKQRYAKGEITKKQFDEMKNDLQ